MTTPAKIIHNVSEIRLCPIFRRAVNIGLSQAQHVQESNKNIFHRFKSLWILAIAKLQKYCFKTKSSAYFFVSNMAIILPIC